MGFQQRLLVHRVWTALFPIYKKDAFNLNYLIVQIFVHITIYKGSSWKIMYLSFFWCAKDSILTVRHCSVLHPSSEHLTSMYNPHINTLSFIYCVEQSTQLLFSLCYFLFQVYFLSLLVVLSSCFLFQNTAVKLRRGLLLRRTWIYSLYASYAASTQLFSVGSEMVFLAAT